MPSKARTTPTRSARFALAGLALVAGCAGTGGVNAPHADEAAAAAPAGAEIAPEFELATVDGRTLKLSDSAGRVRLLDFWATWCAPCRDEIPLLNQLQDDYADAGFEILAITDEDAGVVREFVDEHGVRYTNFVGGEEVSERYGVLGLPTAFLVDSEGRIVDSFLGPKPRKALTAKIEGLLGVPAPG